MEIIKILFEDECEFIKNYILENEENVKSLGPDEYPLTSDNSLSGRHGIFNWLYTPIGDIIIPKLHIIFDKLNLRYPIDVQCWANTFRRGEGIGVHNHRNPEYHPPFICSHIFITGDENIGTYYKINDRWEKHTNTIGEITIFDSMLEHYVPENPTDNIRISMAIDIYHDGMNTDKNYDRYYPMEKTNG